MMAHHVVEVCTSECLAFDFLATLNSLVYSDVYQTRINM